MRKLQEKIGIDGLLVIVAIGIFIWQTFGALPQTAPEGDEVPFTPYNCESELSECFSESPQSGLSSQSFEGGMGETFPKVSPELFHSILHLNHDTFLFSLENARQYEPQGRVVAGVVPHHVTAATMISGFFEAVAGGGYDLVIIVGPNHFADLASVVVSDRAWGIGAGVKGHSGFVADILASGIDVVASHYRVESDHTAGILIPYIYYFLPGAAVAPVLLNRSLTFSDTLYLYEWLERWIEDFDGEVLLVASVDFSHFLTAAEAAERDAVTARAITEHNLQFIHTLSDYYVDSPAAIIIFLKFLQARGLTPQIVDHACAEDFLGTGLEETTTYFIIFGACESRVRLTFVGDIMLHGAQMGGCFDHAFERVAEHLRSADLAVGNLETVLGGFFSDFPLFSAPDEFGWALKRAGIDLLSTANNHSLDQGVDGLIRTRDVLDELGIGAFGTARSPAERDEILVREAGGIRFAFLAYTFSAGAGEVPVGREYLVNIIHADTIRADISAARAVADIVIVTPHMGFEYELFVRQDIRDWAFLMVEAGADIVVAHHPHVVQEMGFVYVLDGEETRRGFIAYSLGNFISSQREVPTEMGIMLDLYFERSGGRAVLADASYVLTWVKFTDFFGETDIQILPVAQVLQEINSGESQLRLRPSDISRLNEILLMEFL